MFGSDVRGSETLESESFLRGLIKKYFSCCNNIQYMLSKSLSRSDCLDLDRMFLDP